MSSRGVKLRAGPYYLHPTEMLESVINASHHEPLTMWVVPKHRVSF